MTLGDLSDMSFSASYTEQQENIWFMGGDDSHEPQSMSTPITKKPKSNRRHSIHYVRRIQKWFVLVCKTRKYYLIWPIDDFPNFNDAF